MSVFLIVFQDLYVDRPLPYLIGSQAFMNQEDVGLGDLSSDGKLLIAAFNVALTSNSFLFVMYSYDLFSRNVS